MNLMRRTFGALVAVVLSVVLARLAGDRTYSANNRARFVGENGR